MPPGLNARKTISSCLKVVGLSTTRHAVRQHPLGEAGGRVRGRPHDRARAPAGSSSRTSVCTASTRRVDRLGHHGADDRRRSRASVGTVSAGLVGGEDHDHPVAVAVPLVGEGVDLGQGDARQEPLVLFVLPRDAGNRLVRRGSCGCTRRPGAPSPGWSSRRPPARRRAAGSRFSRSNSAGVNP